MSNFFKDKKITIMGLGLLGGSLNDIIYLAKNGADVTVTDLKNAKDLKFSLDKLKKYKNITFVLGKHDLKDFKNADIILQPGNVPMDSMYLKEAKKNSIPVFVSESLFAKYAPDITMIGVTGTRGKSMTTQIIYEILSKNLKGRKVHLGGNVRNVSTLALLDKVKPKDVVVMELDSWALHGMGDIKQSPHISVFTSFMPDHMNYYGGSMTKYFADKANIFKYQTNKDVLVIRPGVKKLIPKTLKSKLIVANPKDIAKYKFNLIGEHQKENLAAAVEVAKQFKISDADIARVVKNFKGLEGRLQYVKTVKGVKIYNDNNATTPAAAVAGIESIRSESRTGGIVLISGGADKKLDLKEYVKAVNANVKALILIPGTGTDVLLGHTITVPFQVSKDLKDVVKNAFTYTRPGDTILFSPAFASFGMFNNEYDRGDQFMKIIKSLK